MLETLSARFAHSPARSMRVYDGSGERRDLGLADAQKRGCCLWQPAPLDEAIDRHGQTNLCLPFAGVR